MSSPSQAACKPRSATAQVVALATPSPKKELPRGATREAASAVHGAPTETATLARAKAADKRPHVEDVPDLHVTADACEEAITRHPLAFTRDGALGRLVRAEGDSAPLAWRAYTRHSAREAVGREVRFFRFARSPANPQAEAVKRFILPPELAISALIDRAEWKTAKPLRRVTTAPFLRGDGTVCQTVGYDEASSVFADYNTSAFPRLPRRPSRENAQRALRELADVFVDFPFAHESDRFVPVAAVLSILARDAIRGPVPFVMISANVRGAGKSLLADVIATLATGRAVAGQAVPETDEEWGKALLAIARGRVPLVCFDNVRDGAPFGASALDACLTSGAIAGRLLGGNENVTIEAHGVFMGTANNPSYRGDLIRRVLPCRLDSDLENPEDRRGFTISDIRAHVHAERARLLVAALTLLAAFDAAGRPYQARPWGSFERWSELVSGAILWAGGPDVQETRAGLTALDEARGTLDAMLFACSRWTAPVTARDMISRLSERPDTLEILEAFCPPSRGGKISAKSLGWRLRRAGGRHIDGRWFVERGLDPHARSVLWSVESSP